MNIGYSYFIHVCHISYRWIDTTSQITQSPPWGGLKIQSWIAILTTIIICRYSCVTQNWCHSISLSFDFACYGDISIQICWFWLPNHICYIIVTWATNCITDQSGANEGHLLGISLSPCTKYLTQQYHRPVDFNVFASALLAVEAHRLLRVMLFGTWTKIFF